jgi:hypothetical protein
MDADNANGRDLKNIYDSIVYSRQENDLTNKKMEHPLLAILTIRDQQKNCRYVCIYLNRRISSGISYVAPSPKFIDKQQGKRMERKSS